MPARVVCVAEGGGGGRGYGPRRPVRGTRWRMTSSSGCTSPRGPSVPCTGQGGRRRGTPDGGPGDAPTPSLAPKTFPTPKPPPISCHPLRHPHFWSFVYGKRCYATGFWNRLRDRSLHCCLVQTKGIPGNSFFLSLKLADAFPQPRGGGTAKVKCKMEPKVIETCGQEFRLETLSPGGGGGVACQGEEGRRISREPRAATAAAGRSTPTRCTFTAHPLQKEKPPELFGCIIEGASCREAGGGCFKVLFLPKNT